MNFCKIHETFLVSESGNVKSMLSSLANKNMSHSPVFLIFNFFFSPKGRMKPCTIKWTVNWVCFIISHLMSGSPCRAIDG